ncbi:unnamed protein product [Protopolystoma xenopodis]|uniref:Helicase C-terminal domain-containing protein n=1 Tax=Protopolystoma xenopodis TaxID=117903 RepID=A0A448WMN0_9PLAT|nr:unnamed protein product [Protopolystoma xenopodis]
MPAHRWPNPGSRAGGVGLNLTGANHLVLYDMDWNPANDAQVFCDYIHSLARVWREGQKRCVRLYRLVTAAGMEERMLQRQVAKLSLASRVIGSENCYSLNQRSNCRLSREELKVIIIFRI